MKVEISTLCEYASEHNGHLTIVDTFDTIAAMRMPWRAYFYYVARFVLDEDTKEHKKLVISIVDGDGSKLFETSNPYDKKGGWEKSNLVAGFKGLIFQKEGNYKLCVDIDNEVVVEHEFKVIIRNNGK